MQEIRISDGEREIFGEAITRAYSEGRLSVEEFEKRLQMVNAAVFYHEAQQTVNDLPQTGLSQQQLQQTTHYQSRRSQNFDFGMLASAVTLAFIMILVTLLVIIPTRNAHIKKIQNQSTEHQIRIVASDINMLRVYDKKITAKAIMDIEPSLILELVNSKRDLTQPNQSFLVQKASSDRLSICMLSASKEIICLHDL